MQKTNIYGCKSKKVLQIQSKNVSFCLIDKTGEKNGLLAYSANACSDNFTDFVNTGKWNSYDIDLINNGPCYKYKLPARLLGALGRLNDPVDLTDECKELYIELLVKNAQMSDLMPFFVAASATPWAWFPAEQAMTPRAFSSSESIAIL